MKKLALILALAGAFAAQNVQAWGNDGHRAVGAIAAKQSIKDSDAKIPDAAKMLSTLHAHNETLIKSLKATKELAEEAGDNATDGLLDDWTDQAEQRAWFLSATMGNA